jgi:hypothetical protein
MKAIALQMSAEVEEHVDPVVANLVGELFRRISSHPTAPNREKRDPLWHKGFGIVWRSLALVVKAEGTGVDPSTPCGAPDFESEHRFP